MVYKESSDFISKDNNADIEMLDLCGKTSLTYKIRIDGRLCFMKKLRPELSKKKSYRELFYKEYNTGKKINSPYVVKYIDIKDDADGLCIVMEYVNGITLKEKIEKEPQYFKNKKNIEKLLVQLCKALKALHDENVVHLDINPANIIISQTSNDLKLLDLGFSLSDWDDRSAGTTIFFGAPEALSNRIGDIDARTDIYSIGCLLKYIEEKTGVKLPAYVTRIKRRCLQHEKERRYSSAADIINTIKHRKYGRWVYWAATVAILAIAAAKCGLFTAIDNHIGWKNGRFADRFEADGIFYNITDHDARTVEVTFKGETPDEYKDEYQGGEIDIPETVTYKGRDFKVTAIANKTFLNPYITKINIPESVTRFEEEAFKHTPFSGDVYIHKNVSYIGKKAFDAMMFIDAFIVDSGNKVYDSRGNCNAVIETATNRLLFGGNNTVIPTSVTAIAEGGFAYSGAKTILIPASVKEIGAYAFFESFLEYIVIPESITRLEEYTFQRCSKLREITLPQSLAYIGVAAMSHCAFRELVIPDGVTVIDNYAFDYCEQLGKVTLGKGVRSIGDFAFDGCKKLKSVVSHIPANELFEISDNVFGNIDEECVLYVPKGAAKRYEKTYGWNVFTKIVEM